MSKRSGVVPIFRPNVATRISRDPAAVNDDTQNDESGTRDNLNDREHKLDLTVSTHTENLDDNQCDKENGDPHSDVLLCRIWPEVERKAGGGELERQNGEPLDRVIPPGGKAPRRVDEADGILEESTVDRKHHTEFRQRLHGDQQH